MGIVVGLVNTKGGVGKSMLSTNMVVGLHDSGARTALIDAEEGGPTAEALRRFDPEIESRCCTRLEDIDEQLSQLVRNHDVVLVDTPGKTGDAATTLCLTADLILVPLQASKRDLRQVRPVVKRVKTVQRAAGGKPVAGLIITDAIRNGANMHEVREFAGHSDIRTTELYYVRREEDAEQAARRLQIRPRERASGNPMPL